MDVTIRPERPTDHRAVEELTRAAFWNDERAERTGIGCDEHYLVHLLRDAPEFLPELNLVAEVDGVLVGNVMYSRAHVERPEGTRHDVVTFGPLSVLPSHQRTGIGSALMRRSLPLAEEQGHGAVLVFGHPSYYPRFGFRDAVAFGITTAWGANFPAFMALELRPGALAGVTGQFHESPLFQLDQSAALAYDESFRTSPSPTFARLRA